MNEYDYDIIQINNVEFKYITALPDKFIDDWLFDHFEEGIDFIYGEVILGTHACTTHIKFFIPETAMAFKLKWI